MAGRILIEPTDLYNLLNQGTDYPCLSDPNYLLLIDCRSKEDYAESHVITAKKAPKGENGEFTVPYDAELECKQHVIVYDGNTRTLKEDGPAIQCAKVLWEMGSRNDVRILKGGYETFSALYPFLRTQKIIYMPRELDDIKTYPTEIMPGVLYLGNERHGSGASIQKDLKIKGHINCSNTDASFFREAGQYLMNVPAEDTLESDLYSHFKAACQFIDERREKQSVVLIFSQLGISRSATVATAYLMHHYKWSLKEAYQQVQKCCSSARPNRGFIEQLSRWEEQLLEKKVTDISDPNF